MPLPYKPHTVTRWKVDENVAASTLVVRGTYYAEADQIRGQLTPMTARAAMERTGVEMERPHLFMWDSGADIEPQDLLALNGRYFVASGPQEIWDAEPTTAHRTIMVEEVKPEPVEESNEDL